MDFIDVVVDIDQGVVIDPSHDRCDLGDVDQPPRGDCVELTKVAESERPQERAQCLGCVGFDKDFLQPAVAEQGRVIDGIGAGEHPRDQRGDL